MIVRNILIVSFLTFQIICTGKITPYSDNYNKPIVQNGKIDIDRNGIFDVWIEKQFINTPTNPYKLFLIGPLNDTRLLYNSNLGGAELFKKGDTIKTKVNNPQYWSHTLVYLAWKWLPDTTHWGGPWSGRRGYVPIKIVIKEEYHCAWINMKIDTLNKSFEVYRASYNRIPNQNYVITK
jgi:hypothetical protein